jgi:hypothetical protein
VLVLLALVIGLIGVLIFNHPAVRPEPYVARTVDALTRDKAQQQAALDDIALWPKERHVFLYRYLDDHRRIAARDVLLLNTFPRAFEKYFMTEGDTVSDAISEFLCWKTEVCVPYSTGNEAEYRQMQYRALRSHCLARYEAGYCPGRRGKT